MPGPHCVCSHAGCPVEGHGITRASAWGWRQGITLGRVAFSLLVGTSPSDPAVLGADGNTRGSRACGVL